jgi:hypothetical protein
MNSCPHCSGPCRKDGHTKSGTQRYRCAACGRRHSASGLKGRPPVWGEAMTAQERQKRWKDKQKK